MQKFYQNHPHCLLFLATDDNIGNSLKIDGLDLVKNNTFNRVYFHNLRRQEIIKYTDEYLSDKENKIELQTTIKHRGVLPRFSQCTLMIFTYFNFSLQIRWHA